MVRLGFVGLICITGAIVIAGQGKPPDKEVAKGPFPYTRRSIAEGKKYYLVNCVECHDQDGKGLGRRDFSGTPPADLTDPDAWTHGTTEQAIFKNTKDGTPDDMPPYKDKMTDEEIWHTVNFVRSLWPENKRPKLVDEK
jgi:mono/diheme cytochrome c family protein